MRIADFNKIIVFSFLFFCHRALCLEVGSHPLLTHERLQTAQLYYEKTIQPHFTPSLSKLERLQRQMNVKNALTSKDWYEARYALYQALAMDPHDFQSWFLLCHCLHKLTSQGVFQDHDAFNAALTKAIQTAHSPLDHAVVISLSTSISAFHHLRENALSFATEKEIQQHSQTLIKHFPNVFAPYLIDIPQKTDVASVCISLTHPLKSHTHYENWITLTPKVSDLSVIARANQLCVEGLTFGENYQLRLKAGLPSAEEAMTLTTEESLNIYIPHRKAAIRFRERGYILPSHGPQIVPLVAVNLSKVNITLIHIPERNIRQVQSTWFANQFSRWNVDELKKEKGETIWQGVYHFPHEMDKTTISGLPIDQIIGKKLKAGVYVIEARASDKYDEDDFSAQALIISDIALSTFKGPDGLHVFARSLETAKALTNVSITLIARNNRELCTLKSDQDGRVSFSEKIINGKEGNQPAFLSASFGNQEFTVLNLRNEAFDLRDRGVDGRESRGVVDGFITTERGIYRPGERVHFLSLLRDKNGKAYSSLPLTLKIFRPDGVTAQETVLQDGGFGAYLVDYSISESSQTGTWTAAIFIDPKAEQIGHTLFEVNDFVPPRIEVKAHSSAEKIMPFTSVVFAISAQYYFGPPAANLLVEGESTLTVAKNPFPQWSQYHFGLEEEKWVPQKCKHQSTKTDPKGQAHLQVTIENEPQTTQVLQLETQATVLEVSGRGQTAKHITSFWHQPFVIGISPRFKNRQAPSNTLLDFDVIAVNSEGQLRSTDPLRYSLYEEEHDYVWFRSGIQWQYEIITRDKIISNGVLSLNAQLPTPCQVAIKYGNYRLEVLDEKTGVATSFRFTAGWSSNQEAPDRPDIVEIDWDESNTSVENASIFIKSPFEGELSIAWAGDTFIPIHQAKIGKERTKITIPLSFASRSNKNYILATVYRPANTQNTKMPERAIGVAWFDNKKSFAKNKIELTIDAPDTIEGGQSFTINIKPHSSDPSLRFVVALVDEGTLSLTQFTTPDPFQYFFSQKQLEYELRDSYGVLINPFGTRPGSFDTGAGDEIFQAATTQLSGKSHKVISLFSEIMDAKDQETLSIPFTIPPYTGKLRCMVIAWSDHGLGHAQGSILVQDKVDLYLALPRFLTSHDSAVIPVTLQNLLAPEGDYTLQCETENTRTLQKFSLLSGEEKHFPLDLTFANKGLKNLTTTLQGPNGFTFSRTWQLPVRSDIQPITFQQYGQLEPHQQLILDTTFLKNLRETDAEMVLTIAGLPHLGRTKLIQELIEYPYHCLEQTSSRILALTFNHGDDSVSKQTEINKAFQQLSTLQKLDGSFGLWSSQGHTEPWLTLYAMDVLNIARTQDVIVPKALTDALINWMQELHQSTIKDTDLSLVAYSHYLLAKENQGSLQALHYFADNYQHQLGNRAALAFIAGAFAYYGDAHLASEWFTKAIMASEINDTHPSNDFGSSLRDTAIVVAILAESTKTHPKLFELANALRNKALEAPFFSTQEKAWMVRADMALEHFRKPYQITLNGEKLEKSNPLVQKLSLADLQKNVFIKNHEETLYYTLSISGEPLHVETLSQTGFEIHRDIYNVKGRLADLSALQSGEMYLVVLRGHRLHTTLHHVLLVDLLPGGFEIENAKLTNEDFSWLNNLNYASRLDGRDDRFIAAFELGHQNDFTTAYVVRAVTAGKFIFPRTYVEGMYQPQYFKYGIAQSINIAGI